MTTQQVLSYGNMMVNQLVEYSRLDNPLKEEPETICSEHTITAIHVFDAGVLVTLKGEACTIVKAFDSHGKAIDGFGSLRVLQNTPDKLAISLLTT